VPPPAELAQPRPQGRGASLALGAAPTSSARGVWHVVFFVCPHTRCHSRLPAHGFRRLGCDLCQHELLLAFSCKRRGFCPSCAGRRMAQTAAHLVERDPLGSHPPMGRLGPVPLAVLDGRSQELTAKVHTIIRTTIGQYYVNKPSHEASREPTSNRDRSPLSSVLAVLSICICIST
jgi:hypothetical protein